MYNTVIAKNLDNSPSGTKYPDVFGTVDPSSSHNFIGTSNGLGGIVNNVNSNQIGTSTLPLDPLLSPLSARAGYSSNLYYYVPLATSPLVNAGTNARLSSPFDGRMYRRLLYNIVDVGAIEFKRADSPVVVNPANHGWLFRNSAVTGPVDFSFLYGQGLSDYRPVIGDWDGDNIDTQGVYTRFSAFNIGVFALSNSFNSFDSAALPAFVYTDASPDWVPVAGHWKTDGDITDSVGVYNVSTGVWVLTDTNNSTPPSYPAFAFGGGADTIPVTGDWDGDGRDGIGIFNFTTNRWALSNEITSRVAANFDFVYGTEGNYPVVGDWNGDGIDTVGVYNPSTGQWRLRNSNTAGTADTAFTYGVGHGLIGRAGQWKTVLPGDGTSLVHELAVTPDALTVAVCTRNITRYGNFVESNAYVFCILAHGGQL